MSRIPRILPLVAVAIGGVLAVKALADADALPKVMAGARAFAEDAQAKPAAKAATGTKTAKDGAAKDRSPVPATETFGAETATTAAVPAAAAATPPPLVCAPSATQLAKDAGLSPAELQVLQSLGTRRTQLDAREQDIDTQLKLLAAAETKLDAKLKGLTGLKADLQALLGQTEQKESAEIDRLVIVYSKMKPKDAAAVMATLEDKVRLPIAGKMKEAGLAAILQLMPPADAKKLTESLAHRYDKVQEMAQKAAAPPPAAPAAAPTPDPTAKPAPAPKRPARRPAARAAPKALPAAAPKAQAAAAPQPAAAAPAAAPPAPQASAAPSTAPKPAG